jgi:hypothetical protein
VYSLPAADFHDVTSGFNGYSATKGFDLVTGWGSPKANSLVPGLVGFSSAGAVEVLVGSAFGPVSSSVGLAALPSAEGGGASAGEATPAGGDLSVPEATVFFAQVDSSDFAADVGLATAAVANPAGLGQDVLSPGLLAWTGSARIAPEQSAWAVDQSGLDTGLAVLLLPPLRTI